MDHLIENSENPVPAAGEGGAGEVDEDDDTEALAAHIKKTGALDDQVAKVRLREYTVLTDAVDQVQRVR